MQLHFLRHATFVLMLNDLTLLVDPMLSAARAMDPIVNAGNQLRIPLVELPLSDEQLTDLLARIDGVLVTHTHRDHWDTRAQEILPAHVPVLCQPEDESIIAGAGFTQVIPIPQELEWRGLHFQRTGGQHGRGELGKRMGPVSGFVIQSQNTPSIYIVGDSIWCPEVQQPLERFSPEIVVLYTGAATFVTGGGPITMTDEDVYQVCHTVPRARVIAMHMEAINHCRLTRAALRERLATEHLLDQVALPADGELLQL